jgi:hypothetical protein
MSTAFADLDYPAVAAVADLDRALDELAEASLWSMPAGELGQLVVAVERVARRLQCAQVQLLAQADTSLVAEHEGATSTVAWLRAVADVPVGVGRARLELHRALGGRPLAAAAFAAGQIGTDAATAVCAAMESLPPAVPAALMSTVERLLVEVAREEGTRAVVHRANDIIHRYDPDQLAADERAQAEANTLRPTLRHDGTMALRGSLDREAAALFLATLEPLAKPLPADNGLPDMRDAGARYAAALIQLCRIASSNPALPTVHGEPTHVLLTIALETIEGRLSQLPGRLDTGATVSTTSARRVACDANVIPVLLGSNGQPLDIGRATRVIPLPLRRALIARDQGCAFPGCERPPSWCEAHHRTHWADGGPTSLDNLVLLCEHHHRLVHHDPWYIEMIDGRPWFTPPRWIDSTQTPRLHSRYKIRTLDP